MFNAPPSHSSSTFARLFFVSPGFYRNRFWSPVPFSQFQTLLSLVLTASSSCAAAAPPPQLVVSCCFLWDMENRMEHPAEKPVNQQDVIALVRGSTNGADNPCQWNVALKCPLIIMLEKNFLNAGLAGCPIFLLPPRRALFCYDNFQWILSFPFSRHHRHKNSTVHNNGIVFHLAGPIPTTTSTWIVCAVFKKGRR